MNIKVLRDTPPWDWPPDAGTAFLQVLSDHRAHASDRLAAAELAGNLVAMNDDLADALLAVLRNSAEEVPLRAQAAISLGPVLEQADTDEFEDPDEVPISERMFHNIQDTLQATYSDMGVPKEVRRRILEASVRAVHDWHQHAISTAYASGDRDWMLTAVFAMRYVSGFEDQILEALDNPDPDIHYEAVMAAGDWQIGAAWPHVAALVEDPDTPKELLLAAIGAAAEIRPDEAGPLLVDLVDSDDEDIAEAASDAIDAAAREDALEEEDREDEDEWLN